VYIDSIGRFARPTRFPRSGRYHRKGIIVPAGSSSSSSNAGMTNEGRAVFDGRQDSKTWEFDNLEFQGAEWITYIDNLSLSVSERGDMVTWHASFDVRSRVQKTVSPDVVFTLILLDRNGQELAPSGQISFNRTCGNSYYEKSDSAIAPGLFKRAAGARIRYILQDSRNSMWPKINASHNRIRSRLMEVS
jgi:hypothetical protein